MFLIDISPVPAQVPVGTHRYSKVTTFTIPPSPTTSFSSSSSPPQNNKRTTFIKIPSPDSSNQDETDSNENETETETETVGNGDLVSITSSSTNSSFILKSTATVPPTALDPIDESSSRSTPTETTSPPSNSSSQLTSSVIIITTTTASSISLTTTGSFREIGGIASPTSTASSTLHQRSGLTNGARVAIALGSIAVLAIIGTTLFLWFRRRRRRASFRAVAYTTSPTPKRRPHGHIRNMSSALTSKIAISVTPSSDHADLEKQSQDPVPDWDYRTTFAASDPRPAPRFGVSLRRSMSRIFGSNNGSIRSKRRSGASTVWRRSIQSNTSVISPRSPPSLPGQLVSDINGPGPSSVRYSAATVGSSADSVSVRPPSSAAARRVSREGGVPPIPQAPPPAAAFHGPFRSRFAGRANLLDRITEGPVHPLRANGVIQMMGSPSPRSKPGQWPL